MDTHSIRANCTSGGCGAKLGPGELSALLRDIPRAPSPALLVGYDAADDAAVYSIDAERSIISTVDFFSPMVDDARTFGRIAAANALSDVYAMGGTPFLALNLVCFPEAQPKSVLAEILAGGAEKLAEAGAVLGGGHSIYDKEVKYGLAVTGIIRTEAILRNNTPRVGDRLLLTKPLGVGIVLAAARGDCAEASAVARALESMQRLNRYAAEKAAGYAISACTDVTGFGLLGHLLEMCANGVSARLDIDSIPVFPEALAYAEEYLLTAAGQRNRNHFGAAPALRDVPFAMQEVLFDPQTSGGLLLCVDPEQADALLADIQREDPQARLIGRILPRGGETVLFS